MKRTIVAALAALLAACGSEKQHELSYGAPATPTGGEPQAAADAQAALEQTALFASPGTQPGSGVVGLADELVAVLGGQVVAKLAPAGASAALTTGASPAMIDTGVIDPSACVSYPTSTSIRWNGCVFEDATIDPYTGETTATLRITVDGTFDSNPATGLTNWQIRETMSERQNQGGASMSFDVTADLAGSVAVDASTIRGSGSSTVAFQESMPGFSVGGTLQTTLGLDLRYEADPFCVTGGSLVLEQRWLQRPTGAPAGDQGWRFDWTGCGLFTVAHGS